MIARADGANESAHEWGVRRAVSPAAGSATGRGRATEADVRTAAMDPQAALRELPSSHSRGRTLGVSASPDLDFLPGNRALQRSLSPLRHLEEPRPGELAHRRAGEDQPIGPARLARTRTRVSDGWRSSLEARFGKRDLASGSRAAASSDVFPPPSWSGGTPPGSPDAKGLRGGATADRCPPTLRGGACCRGRSPRRDSL